jgi:hypothetical protein
MKWEAVSALPITSKIHFRGRINDAWGPIPPPDWRAREVTREEVTPREEVTMTGRQKSLPATSRAPNQVCS